MVTVMAMMAADYISRHFKVCECCRYSMCVEQTARGSLTVADVVTMCPLYWYCDVMRLADFYLTTSTTASTLFVDLCCRFISLHCCSTMGELIKNKIKSSDKQQVLNQ